MPLPLPESQIALRNFVAALFNGHRDFCFPIHEREQVPPGCFVVQVSIPELRALQSGFAELIQVDGRWHVEPKR